MTDAQQRAAAKIFAKNWKDRGYEKGDSQIFWVELLTTVFGVTDISQFISFEDQVHLDHTSFIDGYIEKTHVMIEQKSINKSLTAAIKQSDGSMLTPFEQAKRYSSELPYSKRPRWIVTSNFKSFYIYDMEKPGGDPEIILLEELERECQEKINEDMAYALSYLDIYGKQLNVTKLRHEMNNLMVIYGLSDMVYRGITLVKYYAPDGVMLSEIIHSCFCSHYNKTDVEVQQELGIGRTSFYKMKKQALRYLGFYFYEIVVPQAKNKRFKPSLGVEEE